MKIVFIIGARPNFIKAAPVIASFKKNTNFECLVIHTGQHFDNNMSDIFLKQLNMDKPDFNLGVGSGSHAKQTGNIMIKVEKILLEVKPNWIFVFGDVNSTVASALVATKLHINVAHVESGLRSFDRKMPEEINRIITDRISNLLFVTEKSGLDNLKNEGIPSKKICFVGNTMIDSLVAMIPDINNKMILEELKLHKNDYVLVTLHRPSNVDDIKRLNMVINKIAEWADGMEIIWPVHPRVDQKRLIIDNNKWKMIEPIGYIEFLKLMKQSFCVFTDSGGIQEETSFLGIPCFTLRNNTERPITCQMGTNKIITEAMISKMTIDDIKSILSKTKSEVGIPLWDGQSANRIRDCFIDYIEHNEC